MRKIKATVSDNMDPEMRGRLKVECPDLVEKGLTYPDWVECAGLMNWKDDTGLFAIPDIGEMVELQIADKGKADEGPYRLSHIIAPDVKWKPMTEILEPADVPAEAKVNYPNRVVWKPDADSMVVFDKVTGQVIVTGRVMLLLDATADSFLARFTELKIAYDAHTHLGNMAAPTGPPIVPLPPNVATTKVMGK
jgi:hypothetical protein